RGARLTSGYNGRATRASSGAGSMRRFSVSVICALLLISAACAQPVGRGSGGPGRADGERPPSKQSRTLVFTGRAAASSLAPRAFQTLGFTTGSTVRLFNAGLAMSGRGQWHPYLAESLPRLNSDTWQVFADGRMETTYRLRPNLTWHDGTPLSADDFILSW